MSLPVFWLADDHTCARCRWDEMFIEDIISGTTKRVGGAPEFTHYVTRPTGHVPVGVVVFAGGAHDSHEGLHFLNKAIRHIGRLILFIAADEASLFPIGQIAHRSMRLWVMTPRPEAVYPKSATFIGDGSGERVVPIIAPKTRQWFFAGQISHTSREAMFAHLNGVPNGQLIKTDGFLQGMKRSDYLAKLAETRIAPCPGGPQTQDTFRLFEAIEHGCLPVVDALRPDGRGAGYWDMIGLPPEVPRLQSWAEFRALLPGLDDEWPLLAARVHGWWHQKRRELNARLASQIYELSPTTDPPTDVRDQMTVVIPTSPIPSHPSTEIIYETLTSIRERTDAEILIMCDGVRWQQQDRAADYWQYLRALCQICERIPNTTPVLFDEHLHQAEMMRRVLPMLTTPYLMYVEHDTPLVGEIPFGDIIAEMQRAGLNSMRFSHEAVVLEEHSHLTFVERVCGVHVQWVPTLQWSQRPHIARVGFYDEVVLGPIAPSARTMIEDVMYGVVENDVWTMETDEALEKWRLGLYHPEGSIRRSTHTDGRAGEEKYPMKFAYQNDKWPDGAPRASE